MIYLSAQPAQFYFKWQLQVQLFNFNRLGIKKEDIHVLFCFDPYVGVDKRILEFTETCNLACFFFYSDTRPFSHYEPTARPHIIKQHFNQYPALEFEPIFYHDCDIIFKELPDFSSMIEGSKWFFSNTNEYLGIDTIKALSPDILVEMCNIVGISMEKALTIDRSGGAQSLIKGTNYFFWEKVEVDSNNLHQYLASNFKLNDNRFKIASESHPDKGWGIEWIQPWCADMWALLWNAVLFEHEFEIHPDLDFCWAKDHISKWENNKIFHNAGVSKTDASYVFYKADYKEVNPFQTNLNFVIESKCSYMYVKEMEAYVRSARFKAKDCAFFITTRIDSQTRYDNLVAVVAYLNKYFDTTIYVLECDDQQRINTDLFDESVIYEFIYDDDLVFYRSKFNNYLMQKFGGAIGVIQDADVIIDYRNLIEAIGNLRNDECEMVTPYDGKLINISNEKIKTRFFKELDVNILDFDSGLNASDYTPIGGSIGFSMQWYGRIGFDNVEINGWGPEDIERVVRTVLLGGRFKRIKGKIFHLSHPRDINSAYPSAEDFQTRFDPLIAVTQLGLDKLRRYSENKLGYNQSIEND